LHVPVTTSLLWPFAIFCGTVTVLNFETRHSVQIPAQNSPKLTHHTTEGMCFMQTLLIIQRTRLHYGYRTVFLKQNREKLFVATTKHFQAIFRGFFSSICAQIARNFNAFSAQFSRRFCIFPRDFLQGLSNSYLLSDSHQSM